MRTLAWGSSWASSKLGWVLKISQTSLERVVGIVLDSVHEPGHCLMNLSWRVSIPLGYSPKFAFDDPRDSS